MTRYRTENIPSANATLTVTERSQLPVVTQIIMPVAYSRSTYDDVNKGFKKRQANGEIFNNVFNSSVVTRTWAGSRLAHYHDFAKPSNYSVNVAWSTGGAITEHLTSITYPTVSLDTGQASAMAAINVLAAVNKTEADTGAFMGEWDKTRRLHRDLGIALIKAFTEGAKEVAKRDTVQKTAVYDRYGNPILKKNGKPLVKYIHKQSRGFSRGSSVRSTNLANLYLTVRMGLLPLLSELEGACKALTAGRSVRQTARSTESVQGTANSYYGVEAGFGLNHALTVKTVRTWNIRFGILYETSPAMKMAAGFGLTRPLSSAWELLPWSFVMDWFINVGAWLDAVQPSGASKILSAWVSTQETTVHTVSAESNLTHVTADHVWSDSWNEGLTTVTTVKNRAPWNPVVPSLPALGSGLNTNRCFDLAALVLQKINAK